MVNNLPADAGGPYSIPRDDPLDKGMATHSSILAWRIPSTERSLADCSRKESDTTEHTPQALHYLSGLISWCSKNTSSCFSTSVFVYPAFSTSVSRKATWTLKFKWYLTQKSSANVFWLRFAFTSNFSFVFWHLYSASKYRLEFLSYPCQTTRTFWTSTIPYFWSSGGPNISFAQGTRHRVVKKTSSPSSGITKKLHATFAFSKLFYQKKNASSILQLASTLISVEECTVLLLRETEHSLVAFFDQNPLPNKLLWMIKDATNI